MHQAPVFATVLSLIILLIGLISYTRLSVREYPRIDEPVVSVSVTYRGASAEVVESQVTKPLEDSLSGIEGVEVMTSQSRSETSRINVRFTLKRDPDSAAADVRDKVARARGKLPDTIDEPIIAKVEADSQPIIYIAVQAGSLTPLEASDYVKRYVQPRLSVLPGAADVRIFGERQVSMRINLDRTRLAAYKLTVQDVEDAIRRQNAEIPAGRIESSTREFTVVAETDVRLPEQFNNIIVANVGSYPVRIRDVGAAEIGPVDERVISRYNGQSSLNIGVIKQAVANPLDLSKGVRAEVAKMNEGLPPGMKLIVAYDTSVFIDRSIKSVFETIAEAIVLVVLVIYFFLRSLRATIIPIVTIPVSLVGAFGLMYLFGFTVNTLTLLAMVLAIGLVVDDAIVMLENIHRHIESGMSRMQAAIDGAREIGFAIVAMTLTLASVFAPLAFATGRTGRLFIEFALTLAGAVMVSGFIALTLSPMMCSLLLKHEARHSWLYNRIEGGLGAMTQRLSPRARRDAARALAGRDRSGSSSLALGALFFTLLKSELSPIEDRGVVFGLVTAPQGSTPQYTADQIKPIEEFYSQIPEAAAYTAISGFPTVVDGNAVLRLEAVGGAHEEAAADRRRAAAEVRGDSRRDRVSDQSAVARPVVPVDAGRIRRDVAGSVPRAAAHRRPLPRRGAEVSGRAEPADRPAPQHAGGARQHQPRQAFRHRRRRRHGRPDAGDDAGRPPGHALQEGRRAVRRDRAGRAARPHDAGGHQRRLRAGARRQHGAAVQSRRRARKASRRSRSITSTGCARSRSPATLAPGYAIDEALTAMNDAAKRVLPNTAQTDLDGQSREFRKSGGEIYFTFVLALLFIYLVLSAQFESFVHPFVIMLSVPLSMTGALFALWLTGGTLNIYSQVGLVTLVGLITKHGILIVEFSNQLRAKGEPLFDAVIDSATLRLRPILMTTGAMVLGAVPLALATGAGAESRTQIGWVIVGGMSFGTLLTLFVVPTAYTLLAGRVTERGAEGRRRRRRRSRIRARPTRPARASARILPRWPEAAGASRRNLQ